MLDLITAISSSVSSPACLIHDRKSTPLPNQSTISTIGLASELRKSSPSGPAMKMAGGSEVSILFRLICKSQAAQSDLFDVTPKNALDRLEALYYGYAQPTDSQIRGADHDHQLPNH
jgi:hypothetical protein